MGGVQSATGGQSAQAGGGQGAQQQQQQQQDPSQLSQDFFTYAQKALESAG